jgi:hypothetical protein
MNVIKCPSDMEQFVLGANVLKSLCASRDYRDQSVIS